MRKKLVTLAAAGIALAMTACGSASTAPNAQPSDGQSEAAGTLTIWVDETRISAFEAVGAAFEASSGVSLEIVQKPTEDIKTDYETQAPSGAGPDLIVGAHDWIGSLHANGLVSPVQLGDAEKGFSEASRRAFTVDGVLFGVPYAEENIALVRNNALATETPATFDELVAQGKELTPEFPVLIQSGEKGDPYHLYPVQTSFGAPVFVTDDNGDYIPELGMKGQAGEEFASYIQKLTGEGVLNSSVTGDQAKQAFLDGKSAYIMTGPWWASEFIQAGMDISVVAVPPAGSEPSAPFVGVQGVYLNSKSPNAVLANQFLQYLASEEAQTTLYQLGGRMPALTTAAAVVDDPILKGFGEAAANGQPMPTIPAMGKVWEYWGNAELNITNGADPVPTWQNMIAELESAIAAG